MILSRIRTLALAAAFFGQLLAHAQGKCPELPKEYVWNSPEDYRQDTELMKKTLRWLSMAPLNVDLAKRSEANAFVLKWLSGSPDYVIAIDTSKLPFIEEHPELLDSFIHGMALAYLAKGNSITAADAHSAGFQAVVQVAEQSKTLSKSRRLKPLFKAARKNEMKKYAEKILAKQD